MRGAVDVAAWLREAGLGALEEIADTISAALTFGRLPRRQYHMASPERARAGDDLLPRLEDTDLRLSGG